MNSARRSLVLAVLGSAWMFSGCAHTRRAGSEAGLTPREHMSLADTYMQLGDKKLAVQQYQAAVSQDKRYAPALVALGNIAYREQNYKEAREYFQRAHKAAPQEAVIINNLAMSYLAEGKDAQELETILKDALPNAGVVAPYIWDTLAHIWMQQERLQDAEYAIERASEDAPLADASFQQNLQITQDKFAQMSSRSTY